MVRPTSNVLFPQTGIRANPDSHQGQSRQASGPIPTSVYQIVIVKRRHLLRRARHRQQVPSRGAFLRCLLAVPLSISSVRLARFNHILPASSTALQLYSSTALQLYSIVKQSFLHFWVCRLLLQLHDYSGCLR